MRGDESAGIARFFRDSEKGYWTSSRETTLLPHARLLAAPFGPGYRTDHVDLLHGLADVSRGCLTAGQINYFVCREKDQPSHPGFKIAEAKEGVSGQGDPLGARVSESDPVGGKKR